MDLNTLFTEAQLKAKEEGQRLLVVGVVDPRGSAQLVTTVVTVAEVKGSTVQFIRDYVEPAVNWLRTNIARPVEQPREETKRRPAGWGST